MSRKRELVLIAAGILAGAALVPTASAATQYLTATPSAWSIYLEGQRLESYTIQNRNYIPVDSLEGLLQVTYQPDNNTVKIVRSGQEVTRYIPKAGDIIHCDDGTIYTITDVSRWDKNTSAGGPACPHLRLVQAPSAGTAEGRSPALHGRSAGVPVYAKPL